MNILTNIVLLLIALLHLGFLVLEMFFWDHPFGRKTFKMSPDVSAASARLAANQGLYNGFLAAGLFWGAWSGDVKIKIFFLLCVLAAGLYGGLTTKRSILYMQALPGLIGLLLVFFSR